MKAIGLVVAMGLAGFACGDNNNTPDAAVNHIDSSMVADVMIDAPVAPNTLTTYVIDLVKNHTNGTEQPHPFTEFSTLSDPDFAANNTAAYATLFP